MFERDCGVVWLSSHVWDVWTPVQIRAVPLKGRMAKFGYRVRLITGRLQVRVLLRPSHI